MAPLNHAAYYTAKGARVEIKEAPYPTPGSHEVVIKTAAVALNPADPVVQDTGLLINAYPAIGGLDMAGTIVAVGPDMPAFSVGDRVFGAAFFFQLQDNKYGAFQEYAVLQRRRLIKIPEGVSFEQASVLPLGLTTAASALFNRNMLALPPPPKKESVGKTIIIWGGSSSVGACAIQLAVATGLEVITTASPRNHALCKSLGASHAVDYNAPAHEAEIIALTKGKELVGALDAVGTSETTIQELCRILDASNSKKFISTARANMGVHATHGVRVEWINYPEPDIVDDGIWASYLPEALNSGSFQYKPDPHVVGKGLDKVQTAIDTIKAGVSASKIVLQL